MARIGAGSRGSLEVIDGGVKALYKYILFVAMALFMTIIPFYRGMYFRLNFIPAIAVIGVLFLGLTVMMCKYKETGMVESHMDIVLLGLSAAYLLSIIGGVSKMNSLDGILKYIAAFMVYKLVYQLAKQEKLKMLLPVVITVYGFLIAFLSMLGSSGLMEMHGVFGFGERLCGPYQYPNATASVLAAIYMLSIIKLIGRKKLFSRTLFLLALSTMMLAFLATKSRGGMLVLLFSWLVALALLKGKDRLYLLMYSLASIVPAVVMYSRIFNTFLEKKGFIPLFVIFIILTLVIQGIFELIKKLTDRISDSASNKIIVTLIGISIVLMVIVLNTLAPLELTKEKPKSDYEVYSTKPGRTYSVEFISSSNAQTQGTLAVDINSVNNARQRTSLHSQKFTLGAEQKNVFEFTAPGNMVFLTVDLANANTDADIKVDELIIKDKSTGEIVEKLRLKYKYLPDDIGKRINEINLTTESSSERFVFVRDGLNMFKDNFLTGTGSKGWSLLYTKYQSYRYSSTEAHNFYLQTAIESGILGILALLGLLICVLKMSFKLYLASKDNLYDVLGMIALTLTLLAHAVIDFDFSIYAILLLMCVVLGWLSSVAHENNILKLDFKYQQLFNYTAGILAVVVSGITVMMFIGLQDGLKGAAAVKTDTEQAKIYYQKAMDRSFFNTDYVVDYSQLITQEVMETKDKAVLQQIYKNYKRVEELEPYAIKYYSTLFNFYMAYGHIEDANNLAERFIELQPLNPSSYNTKSNINIDLIAYYTSRGKYKEALECIDRIISLEKQHNDANSRTISPFELSQETKETIAEAKQKRSQIEALMEKQSDKK